MATSPWPEVGDSLDNYYLNLSSGHPEYFFHQSYDKDDFLLALIPGVTWQHPNLGEIDCETIFFGPKVLNIFIAQKAYGWEGNDFVWDDASSDYSVKVDLYLERLDRAYKRFAYYKTVIYVDTYTASLVDSDCPTADMVNKMNRTSDKLEEIANTVTGFEWGGKITSQVPPEYFQPRIDEFYGNPLYKLPAS